MALRALFVVINLQVTVDVYGVNCSQHNLLTLSKTTDSVSLLLGSLHKTDVLARLRETVTRPNQAKITK